MKKWIAGLLLMIIAVVLVACGSNDQQTTAEETPQSLVPLEAEFHIEEQAEPGDTISLETKVTQGDEDVEDAHEVLYEVWKANDKEHSEMIEASHEGKGIYATEYTVEDEAIYFVQVHVTARDTHVMPRMEITVGNPSIDIEEEQEGSEEDHEDHSEHGDEESDHDH